VGLVKNSAHWVPKLFSEAQKEERVPVCKKLIVAVNQDSMAYLDKVVIIGDTILSLHALESNRKSKHW